MGRLLKSDKRAQALLFVLCLAAMSAVLGLYLILVQDIKTRASWSASVGSLYFMQSTNEGFNGATANQFLDKAYDAHIEAVRLSPYDADLWVQLAYVLANKYENPSQAYKALEIASTLEPHNVEIFQSYKNKIESRLKKSSSKFKGVRP